MSKIEPAFTQEEIKAQYTKDQLLDIITAAKDKTHVRVWKDKVTGKISIKPMYFNADELRKCISNGQLFTDMDEFKALIQKKYKY